MEQRRRGRSVLTVSIPGWTLGVVAFAPMNPTIAAAGLLTTVWLVSLSGLAAATLRRYEAVEPHMGTLVKITVYTPGEEAARQAFRAGFDRIRALDAILSDYKSDSELNRLTSVAVRTAAPVSRDLFAVLRRRRSSPSPRRVPST